MSAGIATGFFEHFFIGPFFIGRQIAIMFRASK